MAQARSSDGSADVGGRAFMPPDAGNAGSNWLGAALFLGLAGALHELRFEPLYYFLGWAVGCALAAVLIAPKLRRFGRYTLSDFLGARYGSGATRVIGIVVLLIVLWTFLTAQFYGIGVVVAQHLDVDFEIATFGGLAVALACVFLSTFRRALWLPIFVHVVAIAAYAATGLALQGSGVSITPMPDAEAAAGSMMTFDGIAGLPMLVCLIVGIAALPQIGMQRITASSKRTTSVAARWDLMLLLPILIFASAFVLAADRGVDADAFMLMAPAIANLSPAFTALVAIGAFAILLLTATRLLRAILSLLVGDSDDARSETHHRARRCSAFAGTLLLAAVAAYLAGTRPASILTMMAWGLSIAASGLFAPIVLGLWWKRTTTIGAGCGIAAGVAICLFYLIGTECFPNRFTALFEIAKGAPGWWGIDNVAAGLFGIPVALAVTVLVSLVTPAPSPEMQDFIASLRVRRSANDASARNRE